MDSFTHWFFANISQLNWQWPYAFWLVFVPLLVWLLPFNRANDILFFPNAKGVVGKTKSSYFANRRLNWSLIGWWIVWWLLCAALARPVWVSESIVLPREGRNLILAVDISGSMREQDMIVNNRRVNRLTMVKHVVDDFVKQRQGDKIGLILFGSQAFLQSPLTYDIETVRKLLGESVIGLAGQNTAIGDAIGLAVKHTSKFVGERVLILLTDGKNTAGNTDPLTAAGFAKRANLKVYTIGIGRQTFFGSSVDTRSLKAIADASGGKSFMVRNTNELRQIYQHINQLEPTKDEDNVFRITQQLFLYPVAVAFLLMLLQILLQFIYPKVLPLIRKISKQQKSPNLNR